MVKKSYKLDAASVTITPSRDLQSELTKLGYPTRLPRPNDNLTTAKGYNKAQALVINLGGNDVTLQTRQEWETTEDGNKIPLPDSGFIALKGNDLDNVPIRKFLQDIGEMGKGTRFDIACDLQYDDIDELYKTQDMLCELAGFSPSYHNGNIQNPNNSITSGRLNVHSPIRTASKTISNGATLYVGGRQSKFMFRSYNKTAEVLHKTGKIIPPTLRCELEVKQEIANSVRRYIVESETSRAVTAKNLWHNLANDFLTFDNKPLGEILGLGRAKEINLDYSKIEGNKMEYVHWVRSFVAPKFNKLYKDLKPDERARMALSLMLTEEEFKHINVRFHEGDK